MNSTKCVVKGVESLESDDFSGDLEFQEKRRCGKEKVQKYHHKPPKGISGNSYSFEPQFQDEVVYAWLNDHHTWGVNIANLLEQGKLAQVLQILSGTWTSLGYGTENNSTTPVLLQIYQKVLVEELAQANSSFIPVRVSMPDSPT